MVSFFLKFNSSIKILLFSLQKNIINIVTIIIITTILLKIISSNIKMNYSNGIAVIYHDIGNYALFTNVKCTHMSQ